MSDDDKVMEIVSKQFPQALNKVFAGFLTLVIKAAATATDPFFRKNLGERYFSPPLALLSLVAWIGLWKAEYYYEVYEIGETNRLSNYVGIIIPALYAVLAIVNFRAVQQRILHGVRWHSRSKGESWFGFESPKRDFVIEVVLTIALWKVSVFYAAFFALSRYLSYLSEWLGAAARYARYLDAVDAKIEAEFLETALRDGYAPRKTQGLYCPLPNRFAGEFRANVARVAAGIPISAGGVTAPSQRSSATPGSPQQSLKIDPAPPAGQRPDTSKSTTSTAVAGLLVLALVIWAGIHFWPSPHPTIPPGQVVLPAANNRNIAAQDARSRLEREKLLTVIDSGISNQIARRVQFSAEASTRLNGNANQIAQAAPSNRSALTEQMSHIQILVNFDAQQGNEDLNHLAEALRLSVADPQSDPQPISARLQAFVAQEDRVIQTVHNDLDTLEAEITKAKPTRDPPSNQAKEIAQNQAEVVRTLNDPSDPAAQEVNAKIAAAKAQAQENDRLAAAEAKKLEEKKQAEALESKAQDEKQRLAALEAQPQPAKAPEDASEAKRDQERDIQIAKLSKAITNCTSQVLKFKTNFLSSLDDIASVTANVSRSKRKALSDRNDQLRSELLIAVKKEEDSSNHFLESLKSMAADPKSDPQPLNDQIKKFLQNQRTVLQSLNTTLTNLDAEVITAAPSTGFLRSK